MLGPDDARALARELLQQNKSVEAIIGILRKKGLAHEEAALLVSNVVLERAEVLLGPAHSQPSKAQRKRDVFPPSPPTGRDSPASEQITTQIPPQPPEEEEIDGYALVNNLLDQNKTMEEIYQVLEDGGLTLNEATGLVSEVVQERTRLLLKPYRKELRRIGGNNMLIGGGFFLVGSVATIGSYAAAAGQGGGTYMVAAGAIIFGAIQFFRGVGQVGQANRL